ncbi:carbohydate-binding domain-containing protein [Wenzhouxiangella sp. AB-CW3]|uniref:family 20 glycosylhydrolase n=1 Tax=Wenzhouxiangella sp. AB-CW3 TaxID=2771012 RepID=UPI00168BAB18|nr:family 20 glycosylhydrolase [Wenzhouxiangella sp. AB-CW3]QOC21763.1 carbohydate-binding domain-containing protein [Wenzhouxiangella sp. AB-CW3]
MPERILIPILACALWACSPTAQPDRNDDPTRFTREASWHFGVQSNRLDVPERFRAYIEVDNHSAHDLPSGKGDWAWYFHSIRRIDTVQDHGITLEHVQGDLHRITPTSDFPGLAPGDQLRIDFEAAPWIVSYSDWMPRAYMVQGGSEPAIFANTDSERFEDFVHPLKSPEQQLRNFEGGDHEPIATAARRFEAHTGEAPLLTDTEVSQRIIPSPAETILGQDQAVLGPDWRMDVQGAVSREGDYLAAQLEDLLGHPLTGSDSANSIVVEMDPHLDGPGPEGYRLVVETDRIVITGHDEAGTYYGIQTLLALLPAAPQNVVEIPTLEVIDKPRFQWRGMHYDMARNFHGLDVTLRLIEQMGRYKLNRLHLHLTDDEGWRLEIPGLPELTDVGARRCHDLQERECLLTQLGTGPHPSGTGNGYYSRDDFIRILRHAAAHHIEVIPEIDMPGHARAAIKAMEARQHRLEAQGKTGEARRFLLSEPGDDSVYRSIQHYDDNSINVCLDSTYAFVDKVLYELQAMYREAGLQLDVFHMGGDEVASGSWEKAPACQQLIADPVNGLSGIDDLMPYFIDRVASITNQRGLALAIWEDGLMYDEHHAYPRQRFDHDRVIVNPWNNIWEFGHGDRAHQFANDGYEVVQSAATHLYFDHPQEAHPAERGYYWATRYTDTGDVFFYRPDHYFSNAERTRDGRSIVDLEAMLGRAMTPLKEPDNILGIQGQVWSETIRTADQLEQMVYPRLLALAERAWHRASWEPDRQSSSAHRDWLGFAQRLAQVEIPRLVGAGIAPYLPVPGGLHKNDALHASAAWPGLQVEFSLDAGETWSPYTEPVPDPPVNALLRTRTASGVTSRTTTVQRHP